MDGSTLPIIKPRITKAGLYEVSEADYHADKNICPAPSLSSSGARKILAKCPAKFWWEQHNPKDKTEALDMGGAAHEWLLEGDKWSDRYYVLPEDHDGRTKEGKKTVADMVEQGKRPLKYEAFRAIKEMKKALEAHEYAMAAFEHGRNEQSLYWFDEEFGIWCRTRPDCLPNKHDIVADYKTTLSAEPDYLKRKMYDLGYHQQAQWYMDGIRKVGLLEKPRFLFVFQEKEPPYVVTCVVSEPDALSWGEIMNRKAKDTFGRCLQSGKWPAYTDGIISMGLPVYAEYRLQEKHERGEFEVAARAQAPIDIDYEEVE